MRNFARPRTDGALETRQSRFFVDSAGREQRNPSQKNAQKN
jgi:hypothetical protein